MRQYLYDITVLETLKERKAPCTRKHMRTQWQQKHGAGHRYSMHSVFSRLEKAGHLKIDRDLFDRNSLDLFSITKRGRAWLNALSSNSQK